MSTSQPTSFAPDESAAVLYAEKTWLVGCILSAVAYGAVITLYVMCVNLLLKQAANTSTTGMRRQCYAFVAYSSVLFTIGTLYIVSAVRMLQLSFIDNRNFPGGPSAFESVMFSIPISNLGNVNYAIGNWLADGLLVWRCLIIYRGSSIPRFILAIPCLALLASFIMGSLYLVQVSAPAGSPWNVTTINYTLIYAALSLSLNLAITLAVVARLLLYRHRIVRALGRGFGTQYTSVVAMLVESAALYAVFSLLFLIPFGLQNQLANIMLQALGEIQLASALLIIFRVAQGKAWSADTTSQLRNPDTSADRHTTAVRSKMEFAGGASTEFSTLGGSASVVPTDKDNRSENAQAFDFPFPGDKEKSAV